MIMSCISIVKGKFMKRSVFFLYSFAFTSTYIRTHSVVEIHSKISHILNGRKGKVGESLMVANFTIELFCEKNKKFFKEVHREILECKKRYYVDHFVYHKFN